MNEDGYLIDDYSNISVQRNGILKIDGAEDKEG